MIRWMVCLSGLGMAAFAEALETRLMERDRLVAWCVVPFDAAKRGPDERAEMLSRLGLRRLAYDWRGEHLPTFDEEVVAMTARGIEVTAWWMSRGGMDEANRRIFEVIERHGIKPQLWILINEPLPGSVDQAAKVRAAAEELMPLAEAAGRLGCQLGLYNHGGWFGEPANQLEIIREMRRDNVGMVYNFHHGHDHLLRFPELFEAMKPHLMALNLNGMAVGADREGRKIMDIGAGDREAGMIRTVLESGWTGPVGILDHLQDEDSEVVLKRNLDGLEALLEGLKAVAPEDGAARERLPVIQAIPAAGAGEPTKAGEGKRLEADAD
jgi:sugar phosphate isomerase/epimerase